MTIYELLDMLDGDGIIVTDYTLVSDALENSGFSLDYDIEQGN
jgi:hypothetical protein